MIFSNYTTDLEGNSEIVISNSSFTLGNLRIKTANASQDILAANAVLSTAVYSNGVELRANDYATYLTAAGGITGANAAILNAQSGLTGSNVRITGTESNVISLQGGITGANSSINTVQGNLTAYAVYANSTFTASGGNINAVQSNVNSVQSNLTAYAAYANATFSGGGGGGFSNGASIIVSNLAYSANTANTTVKVYTYYNTTTLSLDTVFI